MENDNNNKSNDIIEFLIECLVISKLSSSQKFNTNIQNKKFKRKFRSTIHLSKRLIDIKLDKLIDIKNMENDYDNFNLMSCTNN